MQPPDTLSVLAINQTDHASQGGASPLRRHASVNQLGHPAPGQPFGCGTMHS